MDETTAEGLATLAVHGSDTTRLARNPEHIAWLANHPYVDQALKSSLHALLSDLTSVRRGQWRRTAWHVDSICDSCRQDIPKRTELFARTGSISKLMALNVLCVPCYEANVVMEELGAL